MASGEVAAPIRAIVRGLLPRFTTRRTYWCTTSALSLIQPPVAPP